MQAKSAAELVPISMIAAPQDAVVSIKWEGHSVAAPGQWKSIDWSVLYTASQSYNMTVAKDPKG
jgi:hypothetical protein